MASILQSLGRTVAAGVVLLIIIIALVALITGQWIKFDAAYWLFFMRWLHILSGVMWIGILWYFNFVQTPTMPKIEPAEHRAALSKFITPAALWWFRYGALATVVTGLLLAWQNGTTHPRDARERVARRASPHRHHRSESGSDVTLDCCLARAEILGTTRR